MHLTDCVSSYPIIVDTEQNVVRDCLDHNFFSLGRSINTSALIALTHSGYTLGEKTIYNGIHWLSPYTVAKVRPENLAVSYYLPNVQKKAEVVRYTPKIMASVGKISGDIAIPLSGGNDSRAILACAARSQKTSHLFSYGYRGNPDSECAERVATKFGRKLNIFTKSFRAHSEFWRSYEWSNIASLQNCGVSIPFYQDAIYIADIKRDYPTR